MDKLDIKLSKINGVIQKDYENEVFRKIRKDYPSSEELAITRHEIWYLRSLIASIIGEENMTDQEYVDFHNTCENNKAQTKIELDIE